MPELSYLINLFQLKTGNAFKMLEVLVIFFICWPVCAVNFGVRFIIVIEEAKVLNYKDSSGEQCFKDLTLFVLSLMAILLSNADVKRVFFCR